MRLEHSQRSTPIGEGCYCSTLSDAAVKAMSTLSAMLPIQACTVHTQLELEAKSNPLVQFCSRMMIIRLHAVRSMHLQGTEAKRRPSLT